VVPEAFANFFVASTGAGAALAGLLFVAISLAPAHVFERGAPVEWQAVAQSAFTWLVNAFLISLAALIPSGALGWSTLVISLVSLGNAALLALIAVAVVLYALEVLAGWRLAQQPAESGPVYLLAALLLGVYALALLRAWELLGARRGGGLGWLSVLRDVDDGLPGAQGNESPGQS
jgi:hypothetical protein